MFVKCMLMLAFCTLDQIARAQKPTATSSLRMFVSTDIQTSQNRTRSLPKDGDSLPPQLYPFGFDSSNCSDSLNKTPRCKILSHRFARDLVPGSVSTISEIYVPLAHVAENEVWCFTFLHTAATNRTRFECPYYDRHPANNRLSDYVIGGYISGRAPSQSFHFGVCTLLDPTRFPQGLNTFAGCWISDLSTIGNHFEMASFLLPKFVSSFETDSRVRYQEVFGTVDLGHGATAVNSATETQIGGNAAASRF